MRGVRQECVLSPILFNLYGEQIMRRALENWERGVKVGGQIISNLRFADDTTLLAKNEQDIAELIERVERESRYYGLEINRSKTKVMIVDRANLLQLSGRLQGLEVVQDFIYLGSLISAEGGCERDIRRRIATAKGSLTRLYKIWKDRGVSNRTKIKLIRTLIFPIFLYAAETWTIKSRDRERIDAFEMWCWRRMLRIPWTARRTNDSILRELRISERLSAVCSRRVLSFFGHIARREPENLERTIITGNVPGKRSRGRAPARWSDQIKDLTGGDLYSAMRAAENRKDWRRFVLTTAVGSINHDPQQ